MLPEKFRGEHIHVVAAMSVRPDVRQSVSLSVRQSVRPTRVRPKTSLFEVRFRNCFTEITTMFRRRVARKFGSLPWRLRSQRDIAAKSCPAHNFVIWSRVSKIFHKNDHHIETTCRPQMWIATLKVKVTLQQNRVRPITLWFEVEFYNYFTGIITILRRQHLGCYLEGQGHSMTLQQNRVWPKTLLFEVRFYN